MVTDPTDDNFLIATFSVATRTGGSLPFPVEVQVNNISGGSVIGRKPVNFRAPIASVKVRFDKTDTAIWTLDNDQVQASIADRANSAPVFTGQHFDTSIGSHEFQVQVADPDGDPLVLTLDTVPFLTSVEIVGPDRIRISASDFGHDRFDLRVVDSHGASATATFTVDSWIPYTTPVGSRLTVNWLQYWNVAVPDWYNARQYRVVGAGQIWDVPWGEIVTFRQPPLYGAHGTGYFADAIASKIPFDRVWADIDQSGVGRDYSFQSYPGIPAGLPITVTTSHPDGHQYTHGWTNGAVNGYQDGPHVGSPELFKIRTLPAIQQIWVLPAAADVPAPHAN